MDMDINSIACDEGDITSILDKPCGGCRDGLK